MASIAAGLTSLPGSEPPDQAIGRVAGVVLEEAEGHLGAAGVVGAQEQHGRLAVVDVAFDPGQGLEPLPGEPLGEQRQEVRDGGASRRTAS